MLLFDFQDLQTLPGREKEKENYKYIGTDITKSTHVSYIRKQV